MAINLNKNISDKDREALNNKNNQDNTYQPGFEPTSSDFDFFGSDDTSDFGSSLGSSNASVETFKPGEFQQTSWGTIQSQNSLGGTFGSVTEQPKTAKQEVMDALTKTCADNGKTLFEILTEMLSSIRTRTVDDLGYLSRNLIALGVITGGASLLLMVIGVGAGIKTLYSLSAAGFGAGGLTAIVGLITIGIAAIIISLTIKNYSEDIDSEPNIADVIKNDSSFCFDEPGNEDLFDSKFSGLFDEDETYGDDEEDYSFVNNVVDQSLYSEPEPKKEKVDLKSSLDAIREKPMLTREVLFNTFRPFFVANTPNFASVRTIEPGTDEFQSIEILALKALMAVTKSDMASLNSSLISAKETFFSYEIRLERVKGLKNLSEINKEIEAYFREGSDDLGVSASTSVEGDEYKILIIKGNEGVITLGDIFKTDKVTKYFLDTSNKLPFVAGVDAYGQPLLVDSKNYDAMMIAGKPRSGKSWYVLSILLTLMAFNTPEEVQLLIIDPKESNLFKTLGFMPHVCGVHNDENIIKILTDIVEKEAPRRKKLLADNRCDTILDLRKQKNILVPILYVLIDEVMSVLGNLGAADKDFLSLLRVFISQFPSLGIKLIIVPHRAQGVIDKTNRTLFGFVSAVRAENSVIKETLDIDTWNKTLVNQGDLALKMAGVSEPLYAKGPAVTLSDSDNSELIETISKAFYKMGVDIPDMASIGSGFNRDEDYIREQLCDDGVNKVRYSAQNIFNDI